MIFPTKKAEERAAQVLDASCLAPFLSSEVKVYWKERTGSTNTDAKEIALRGEKGPAVCTTEIQEAGRGRLGRSWATGQGEAVELSVLLRPNASARTGMGLGLAASLAVCSVLERIPGLEPKVKWPNDLLVNGRKICGILVESTIEQERLTAVVIGVGVNLNQKVFPPGLEQIATSVARETARRVDRAEFAATLVDALIWYAHKYFEDGPEAIRAEYKRRSAVFGRTVNVLTTEGVLSGVCVGFGPLGELLVSIGGDVQTFTASDVSVREASNV